MNEKRTDNDDVIKIDLKRLLHVILHRAWLVIIVSILCAVLSFAGTLFFITPQYESAAMFYVNNNNVSLGDASFSLTSGDITAAKSLVDSYIVILRTRTTLNAVIDYAGVDRTYAEVNKMISAAPVNDTEIFEVVVTSTDPNEAERIANAISYILPKRISSSIGGTSAQIVDMPIVPSKASSPSYTNNTILGFLLGIVLSVLVIALREIFDTTIRVEEDISQNCNHPILVSVPDMAAPSKGGYYSNSYGSKRPARKAGKIGHSDKAAFVGSSISFAASEAYKLLRTKLQFSFAGDDDCRVIGISSALAGEGKSLSAVNLCYTLSQLNKRVLLIDCDMRRPSICEKLPVRKRPGLSGYLSGQNYLEAIIQKCGIKNEEDAFEVIAAGQNPPNPIELLSSAKMTKLLERLRSSYDYVILDLPPVGEVSDALAVAKETDGILVVVRQNYCDRGAVSAAIRQLEFVESKILGIIYNAVSDGVSPRRKGYYKYNYRRYRDVKSNGGRYMSASRKVSEASAATPNQQKENNDH